MYSEFVPNAPVLLSPCAKLPNYFPNAVFQIYFNSRSCWSFWYLWIVSPMVWWMTGAQFFSISRASFMLFGMQNITGVKFSCLVCWSSLTPIENEFMSSWVIIIWVRKLRIAVLGWRGATAVGEGIGGSSKIICLGWDCMFALTWGSVKITGVAWIWAGVFTCLLVGVVYPFSILFLGKTLVLEFSRVDLLVGFLLSFCCFLFAIGSWNHFFDEYPPSEVGYY